MYLIAFLSNKDIVESVIYCFELSKVKYGEKKLILHKDNLKDQTKFYWSILNNNMAEDFLINMSKFNDNEKKAKKRFRKINKRRK